MFSGGLATLEAQVPTATIYGIVRDSTGAVLPGAAIMATESVQLVQTATATQQESIGTLQVTDLPLARRNVVGPTLFSKLRGARGLKAFREEGAVRVHYLVSQDRVERKSQGIEYIHWETFLKKLWADFPK